MRIPAALVIIAAALGFGSVAPVAASNPSASVYAIIGSIGSCDGPRGLTALALGSDDTVAVACQNPSEEVRFIRPGQLSGVFDSWVPVQGDPVTLVLPWGDDSTTTADDSLWVASDDTIYNLVYFSGGVPVSTAITTSSPIWGMAIGPGSLPYLSMPADDSIQAPGSFAVTPSTVLDTGAGSEPRGLAASDDTLYIALTGSGRLAAMNFAAPAIDDSVALPGVLQVALGDDTLYALSTDDTLWQLDPVTLDVVGPGITVEAVGSSASLFTQITVDDASGRVIVSGGAGTLTIVDQATFAASATISLPGGGAGNAATRAGYIHAASGDASSDSIKTLAPVTVGVDSTRGRVGDSLTFTVTNTLGGGAPDAETLSGATIGGVPMTGLSAGVASGDSRIFTAIVPATTGGMITAQVNGGNSVAIEEWSPLPDPVPAGPPRDVTAVPGDASVVVTWNPPATSGSFAITSYQVLATPSDRSCVSTGLSCTVTGLPNGSEQLIRVRALTGAGWGAWSDGITVTPVKREILLTGERSGRTISLGGESVGLAAGAELRVWMRTRNWGEFRPLRPLITVGEDGTFSWTRNVKRNVPVRIYVSDDDLRSNTIRLR